MSFSDSPRILVVEDEMMVAMLLEDMLTELGYLVVGPVSDVNAAIKAARQERFDAAILDVNLAGREVYPAAEELAARGIPFAFSTGYGGGGLNGRWDKRPVLQKPFQKHELHKVLGKLSDTNLSDTA